MHMWRRSERSRLAAGAVSLLAAAMALAACGASDETDGEESSFPDRDITIIVGFDAGGPSDLLARAITEPAAEELGVDIVLTNVPGAGGAVGASRVANANPDGYTIGLVQQSTIALAPLIADSPVSMDDFDFIAQFSANPVLLVTNAESNLQSLDDIVGAGKSSTLKYAYTGYGTSGALAMEAFKREAGLKIDFVPFDGSALGVTALLGGHVDMALAHPPDVVAQIAEGTLTPILAFGEYPGLDELIPGIQSFKELGYEYESAGLTAIAVPKGLPQSVLERLETAFAKAAENEEFRAALTKSNFSPSYLSGEETLAKWTKDRDFFAEMVEQLDLSTK